MIVVLAPLATVQMTPRERVFVLACALAPERTRNAPCACLAWRLLAQCRRCTRGLLFN